MSETMQAALAAIQTITSEAEARILFDAARSRIVDLRAAQSRQVAATIDRGTRVTFKGRSGLKHTGIVEKVNRTTATVRETRPPLPPAIWRVSLVALTVAPEAK